MPTTLPLRTRSLIHVTTAAIALVMAVPSIGLAVPLVTNQAAARLGLERAWFAQVRVDRSQHKVVQWVLDKGTLFALTSAGTVQAIDASTGKTLWTIEVGNGQAPAVGIAVHSDSQYVVALGAGRMYLLDRTDGHHLWSRQIGGAASAAPALSKNYAYVALLNGLVEGYRLDDPSAFVWQYQSSGHLFQSPNVTGEIMSWPSDRGSLYVAQANNARVMFHVEADDEIVAAPAEQAPHLYFGSLDGYLYCIHAQTGSEQWRYATGFAITSQPAVLGEKVFVASIGPALHAIDTLTGHSLWQAGGVEQFVALGEKHTYGMDPYGTLVVLDNESGVVDGRLATGVGNSAIVNGQSDRIFLINDGGLVQCLHEIGATKPTWHRATQADEAAMDSEDSGTKEPAPEAKKTDDSTLGDFEPEDDDGDFGGFGDADPFQ